MKLLIINPNSNDEFTGLIRECAEGAASPGTDITCVSTPGAPPLIDNYIDEIACGPGMVKIAGSKHHRPSSWPAPAT